MHHSLSRASSSSVPIKKGVPNSEGKAESVLKVADAPKERNVTDGKDGKDGNGDGDSDEEEATFSRAASVRSTTSSVKRDVVGVHNWYPIKPIVATIPAHRSTIWSCAFSTIFKSMADLHVPLKVDLGHNEFRIDQVAYAVYFLNFSALSATGPDRFPIDKAGIVKGTRLLTESERNDQRVKKKEEMIRFGRVTSTESEAEQITRASSTGSTGSKSKKDNIIVDDFLDQEELNGKYVVIHIPKEEPAQFKRAPSLKRVPSITRASSTFGQTASFERSTSSTGVSLGNVVPIIECLYKLGVEAVIVAMDQVQRHTEIKGKMPDINIPIM